MSPEQQDPAFRAESITPRLIVRTNTAGEPVWLATWRDSTGRPVNRTVGPAWLVRRNRFVAKHDAQTRRPVRRERWRQDWEEPTKGRPKTAQLSPGAALKRAYTLVLEGETRMDAARNAVRHHKDPRTMGQAAAKWLELKAREVADGSLKRSTYVDYRAMLAAPDDERAADAQGRPRRALVMRHFGSVRLRAISPADLESFFDRLEDGSAAGLDKPLTTRTRRKYEIVLGMVFAHAKRKGWVDSNPLQDRPRRKGQGRVATELETYDAEQIEQLSRAMRDGLHRKAFKAGGATSRKQFASVHRTERDDQDATAVVVAGFTGIRLGELAELRWRDIRFNASSMRIARSLSLGTVSTPKSGKGRDVPLSDRVALVLATLSKRPVHTAPDDLVFPNAHGGHIDPQALARRFKKAAEAVHVEDSAIPVLRWHALRHSFGTSCAAGGVDPVRIKAWMGHSSLAVTEQYMHARPRHDDALVLSAAQANPAERATKLQALADRAREQVASLN